MLCAILAGVPKANFMTDLPWVPSEPKLADLANSTFLAKGEHEIRGSGYCVESLEAALWCFWNTESFEEAVLRAANLGEDADTTAAIVGQIAGAHYGVEAIPDRWIARLTMREDIEGMAINLYERFGARAGGNT
jgi:ADP-ribosyl-[dinitrogen reductase] hydrolase